MPKVNPQLGGSWLLEVQRNRCGPFAKHMAWWDRRRVLGTDIPTVRLPRPLEKNTKTKETFPFSVPFPINKGGAGHYRSSQQGSSYFRPAALGLGGAGLCQVQGGAGSVKDDTFLHPEGRMAGSAAKGNHFAV